MEQDIRFLGGDPASKRKKESQFVSLPQKLQVLTWNGPLRKPLIFVCT